MTVAYLYVTVMELQKGQHEKSKPNKEKVKYIV